MHRIGLIGSSIEGSLSPAIHESEASSLGLGDYRYELIDIALSGEDPGQAGEVLRRAAAEGFTGFNVTHPCKQTVLRGLDALSEDARALQAVNTVTVDGGRFTGHNTDRSGFLRALQVSLGNRTPGQVVLLGAGGAGAAVAHALVQAGADRLLIADVDLARARRTAEGLAIPGGVIAVTPDSLPEALTEAAGLVNATPIGMDGHPGAPVEISLLRPDMWVGDVVYRPARTELLSEAARLGCVTVPGIRMLVEQAADSFALLTGLEPDRARMRAFLGRLPQAAGVL